MKNIALLGSTGSIGTQTLDIASVNKDIKVEALSAFSNIKLLKQQALKFKPKQICIMDEQGYLQLKKDIDLINIEVLFGLEGLISIVSQSNIDVVVNALVGISGLIPTIKAIENKKDIALANKETLVTGGELVMDLIRKNKVNIYPIDSEHSAIFQCLQNNNQKQVNKIYITASGGPFRDYTDLKNVTLKDALKHPNWVMGKKITIDSATLMNKGLEVIEAKHLFNLDIDKIDVIVHPQSVVHSMVEYIDGSIIAQLGVPDMKVPISYALTYPDRIDLPYEKLDFMKYKNLTFEKPKLDLFPCLALAYKAIKQGGVMPTILNGANEICVDMFLNNKISFLEIPKLIEKTMNAYTLEDAKDAKDIKDIIKADLWARNYVKNLRGE